MGFSLQWLLWLPGMGLRACRASICSSWALKYRLSSCGTGAQLFPGMWDLLGPGIEPMSPALVGGIFTTELARKPEEHFEFYLFLKIREFQPSTCWVRIRISVKGLGNGQMHRRNKSKSVDTKAREASKSKKSLITVSAAVKSSKMWMKNCPLGFATKMLVSEFSRSEFLKCQELQA